MDLRTALQVFGTLEALRYDRAEEDGFAGHEPILNVRLDAATQRSDDGRRFRVRVTLGGGVSTVTKWAWEQVLAAAPQDASVDLVNDGIEIS